MSVRRGRCRSPTISGRSSRPLDSIQRRNRSATGAPRMVANMTSATVSEVPTTWPGRRVRVPATTGLAVVIALAATHAAVDIPVGAFGALQPTLKSRFALSQGELAGLVSVFAAASLLTQPLAGRMADRLGSRTVAALGAAVAAVLLSVVSVMHSVPTLCLALVLGG